MSFVIEEQFEYKELPCVIIFGDMGHRCGYVGVPENHKWYGLNHGDETEIDKKFFKDKPVGNRGIFSVLSYAFSDRTNIAIDELIDVHGSITYAGKHPLYDGYWYFGFDCGHYGDKADLDVLKIHFPKDYEYYERFPILEGGYGEIRTKEYVHEQCIKLAEQLLAYFK